MVAVEGWTESTDRRALELARLFDSAGVASFIYTDIERDGMMSGPNLDATREFAEGTETPVILSGGVSTLEDVRRAVPLAKAGVTGIIIGRALYEGSIDLRDAIGLVEN
jgi:phosphoribosylformimino-5-aminoimidazole carboxamide ribotide isomerase